MLLKHGYQIGGATGLVGDPSGRSVERQPADQSQIEDNVLSLSQSINAFFDRAILYAESRMDGPTVPLAPPTLLSNLQWHQEMGMLDFLRTVGIHARVNTMLNRERYHYCSPFCVQFVTVF